MVWYRWRVEAGWTASVAGRANGGDSQRWSLRATGRQPVRHDQRRVAGTHGTIDDLSTPDADGLRLSKAAAPLIDEAIGLDIPAERDQKWQDAIQRLNDLTENPPNPPETLRAELRDYQVSGYQWLSKLSRWGLGGCLADDMGLGKTVQTLGVLLDRANLGAALIVAPTSVGINWVREVQRFSPSLHRTCIVNMIAIT